MTFLDELAERLINSHGADLKDCAVILPSKRSSLYLKKALSTYKSISSNNPGNAEVHFDLATLYASLNKKDKALFHMKYAERLFLKKNNLKSARLAHQQISLIQKNVYDK